MTTEERKSFLKRYRWNANQIARELNARGMDITRVAVSKWINGVHKPKSPALVAMLKSLLERDLANEGKTLEDFFNLDQQ